MLKRMLPFGGGWSLVYWALSVAVVIPILSVAHPPLQDMPQHLAALSVLRNYPDLNLGAYFELTLLRTQYLAYYGVAYVLSFVFGVALANKLLLCAALVSLPWSLGFLLRSLGKDPRLGLFAFGLSYNAHLILGFLNFVAALPLMFWGLTAAVRYRHDATPKRGALLAAILLLCFYTHVVPFAFLGLGAALVLVGDSMQATLRRVWVFVPAGLGFVSWLLLTPAGSSTLAAAGGTAGKRGAQFASVGQALRELPMWLTDVLTSERDEQLFAVWLVLLVVAFALGTRAWRVPAEASEAQSSREKNLLWRLSLLCPLAVLAYFVAPTGYDWIWPISARFPVMALLFACLLVPCQREKPGHALFAAVALVSLLGFAEVGRAFAAFEREEVGDLAQALDSIPAGERVAGLMFERGSKHVKFSPFIHGVAYYQAQKGGAVMFTFADFPQSPFHFRAENRPPSVVPRWEWQPERVDPARDLTWYNYVLVRGNPGRIERQREAWKPIFEGIRWRVYKRE